MVVWYSTWSVEYHTHQHGGVGVLARPNTACLGGMLFFWGGPLRHQVTTEDARLSRAVLRNLFASETPPKTAPQKTSKDIKGGLKNIKRGLAAMADQKVGNDKSEK